MYWKKSTANVYILLMSYKSSDHEILDPGQTYNYTVKITGLNGGVNVTNVVTYTYPSLINLGLTYDVSNTTINSIRLKWTNYGYTFISIKNTTLNGPTTTYTKTSNITQYDSNGIDVLTPDMTYNYLVTLSNEHGDNVSETITVYTLPTLAGLNVAYDVSNSTYYFARVKWVNTGNYTSISLRNTTLGGAAAVTTYTAESDTTYYDSNGIDALVASRVYTYAITIYGSYGNKNYTSVVVYTLPTFLELNFAYDVTTSTSSAIQFAWTANPYTTIAIKNTTISGSTTTTYTRTAGTAVYNSAGKNTLAAGKTYTYLVTLTNDAGYSVTQSFNAYTIPSLSGLGLTYQSLLSTVSSLRMSWTNIGYTTLTLQNITLGNPITSYTSSSGVVVYDSSGIETLTVDSAYTYTVTLLNDYGSQVSTTINAYTWPSLDGFNLTYVNANSTTSSVYFTWVNTGVYTSVAIKNTTISGTTTNYAAGTNTIVYDSTGIDNLASGKTYTYTVSVTGFHGGVATTTLKTYTLPSTTGLNLTQSIANSSSSNVYFTWSNSVGYSAIGIQNATTNGPISYYSYSSGKFFYDSSGIDTLAPDTSYNYTVTLYNDISNSVSTSIGTTSMKTMGYIYYYYSYTGADQIFVVPQGAQHMLVKCWGAGGGSAGTAIVPNYQPAYGGGGGYTYCQFSNLSSYVGSPLKIIVGQGGSYSTGGVVPSTYGGGGGSNTGDKGWGYSSGGGRTAVQMYNNGNYIELITAGGGGGGGENQALSSTTNVGCGGAGGGLVGGDAIYYVNEGGRGGGQSSGGAGGTGTRGAGSAGTQFTGGTAPNSTYACGGGGGWYGGGSGTIHDIPNGYCFGGGGGGSSYVNTAYCSQISMLQASQNTVANGADLPSSVAGSVGNGGPRPNYGGSNIAYNPGTNGQNGYAIIAVYTYLNYNQASSGASASILLVGGGGAGGHGGGGGGGVVYGSNVTLSTSTTYSITVGSGGAKNTIPGTSYSNGSNVTANNGANTTLLGGSIAVVAYGGGGGAYNNSNIITPASGGSGGGGAYTGTAGTTPGGTSNQPSFSGFTSYGNSGGGNSSRNTSPYPSGGGGGAGGVGSSSPSASVSGNGGPGIGINITGTTAYYGGGGGGGLFSNGTAGSGGIGGGGTGSGTGNGQDGTANTGGGGGGGYNNYTTTGGAGGSGVAIVSIPSGSLASYTGSPVVTTNGSNTVLTFNQSGSFTTN